MLTELAEGSQRFNLFDVWIHAERFRPLFGAQAQSVIGRKSVRGGREDGRGRDPGDCGKRWKLDTFPRTVARGPIELGATTSRQLREKRKRVKIQLVYVRGAFCLVPFHGGMARGQGSPSAVAFVLSPLVIGLPIIFIENNPGVAVLAPPAACFDLQDGFLSTRYEVRRRANVQMP